MTLLQKMVESMDADLIAQGKMMPVRLLSDWPIPHYHHPTPRLFFVEVDGRRMATLEFTADDAIIGCQFLRERQNRINLLGSITTPPEMSCRIIS